MNNPFGQLNVNYYQPPHLHGIHHVRLHAHEELRAELVVLPVGASIPSHSHENAHELFDVLEGCGSFVIAGQHVSGERGKCVFVAAGAEHSMVNDGEAPWVVRITYQERIYPRHMGKLVGRAIRKRLRLV